MTDDQLRTKSRPRPLSPIKPNTDFDFDGLDRIDESEKENARRQVLMFVEEVLKWITSDMKRHRGCSAEYRVAAMAWAMQCPVFHGKTLLEVAEKRGLNRIVLHRYVALFVRRFRIKHEKKPKQ